MIGNYFSTVLLTEARGLEEHVMLSIESCVLWFSPPAVVTSLFAHFIYLL